MSTSPPACQITLPSINELFPEHLLASPPHRYPSSSPKTSPTSRYPPASSFDFPNASTRLTTQPRLSPTLSRSVSYGRGGETTTSPTLDINATPCNPTTYGHTRCTAPCCSPTAQGALNPLASSPFGNNATRAQVAAPYSFEVLRPNPLTAGLENVASSTNAAEPPRAPTAAAYGCGTGNDAIMTSITKAGPAFRVHIPTSSPAAPLGYPHAFPPYGRAAEGPDARPNIIYPPSFSANSIWTVPASNGAPLESQGPPREPTDLNNSSEEKKHCCPHCNKRFNRPSSLNIHVNTHTGAKPFVCRYPGCNRKFNVNSNMRRHYRNHLTNSRRRDNVARMLSDARSPSPSTSTSPPATPEPPVYVHRHPESTRSYSSQSPVTRTPSYSDSTEYDGSTIGSGRGPSVKGESPEPPISPPKSNLRDEACRIRSNSSPLPRYRDDHLRHRAHTYHDATCKGISTTLRPAFPQYVSSAIGRDEGLKR